MEESRSLSYSIEFPSNAEQAEAGVRSLTSSLGNLQNEINGTEQDFNGLQGGVQDASDDLGDLSSEVRETVSNLGGLQSEASDAADSLDDIQDAAGDTADSLDDLQDEAGSMGSAFRKSFLNGIDSGNTFASSLKQGLGGALTYVGDKAGDFKENFSKTVSSIGNGLAHPIQTIKGGLGNALQNAKNRFIDMARGAEKAEEETDSLGETADGAKKDVDELGDSAEKSGGKFEKFGSVIKGIGVALAAATTAIGAFAASSVNTGMAFDSSMSQVAATMGYTVEELHTAGSEANETYNELREFAMEMGSTTAFSASQAADALNYMALAGYDADKSMAMLPNVLNLAAAGGMELATASDMVTDAQSALGLTMDETTELVDKMAKTSSKSNTSVSQLGEAILTIGGTAKNLAGGTTELSTALGILADNGVKGAEGGTALRNIVLSLSAPTDAAAKSMEKLGLKVFDADGNMRPLNDTFNDLNGVLSTMSQEEQTQVLNELFNKVDLKSVNALLANSGDRFDELSGYIDNAAGAAEAMAEVQLDNLEGDVTMFKSALEGAQIIVSDGLTPTLREFVQFGTNSISTLSDAFKEGGLSGAMTALGTILSDGLKMIVDKLPSMVDAGMQLLGALGQGLIDNLPIIVDAALQIISSVGDGILKALPQIASAAITIISTLASGIGEALPTLIPTVIDTVLTVVDTLIENMPLLIDAGMQLLSGLTQGIIDAIPLLVERLLELIIQFVNFLTENLPTIIEQGSQLILNLAMGLINAIPLLVAQLPALITSIVGFVTENLPTIIETGINLVVQLGLGLIQAIPQLVAQLPQIISAIIGGLAELPKMMLDIGGNIVKGLWEGIKGLAGWIWDQVSGWASSLWDGICGFFGIHSPSKKFAYAGEMMVEGLAGSIDENGDKAVDAVGEMSEGISEAIDATLCEINPVVGDVGIEDISSGVEDVTYGVNAVVGEVDTPAVSDVSYGVSAVVEDFNPPDVSASAVYNTETSEEYDDIKKSQNTDTSGDSSEGASAFAPVINITVNGDVSDESVENLNTSLRDTVRELFMEFREEELERMALKQQYAF